MNSLKDGNHHLKICVLGDSMVGKTTVVNRYVHGTFSDDFLATLGCDIALKKTELDGQKISIIINDVGGADFFYSIRRNACRSVMTCIIVYSIEDRSSFENITKWLDEFKNDDKDNSDIMVAILGNKRDLVEDNPSERKVTFDELKKIATRLQAIYYAETSAKTGGDEINECFTVLIRKTFGLS